MSDESSLIDATPIRPVGPRRWEIALTAVLVVIAGCVACASSLVPGSPSTAETAPPRQSRCWQANQLSLVPMSTPPASARPAGSIGLDAELRTGGDEVSVSQAVLDSPVPANQDPDQAIVLLAVTVRTTDHRGWRPDQSLAVAEFHQQAGGVTQSQLVCPLTTPDIAAAIRASGRVPMPNWVAPRQGATGWVAFRVFRGSTALTLRLQRLDRSGFARADYPLLKQ